MSNGSLENWLYKEDRHLNLHQRVTVMLDVAMAIEYLHHGHVTPIVHCDLKPANVLLDEDMMAHVGDLGISKILAISKSMAYTETLGTLGYIAPVVKNLLIFWPMIGPKILIFALGLVVLNLENNNFHGGIPYGLGEMPRLKVIDVKNNQLSGSIPTSLFQNQRVQVISLVFNELSGEMWRGPWYVPKLRVLNLWNNSLTGIVPPSVGNATKMMNFSMSGNRVSGNIPKEIEAIFNISSLEMIDFSFNNLSGRIPTTIGLPNLKELILAVNQLEGEIPLFITNASKLEILELDRNSLTGTVPNNLGNLRELRALLLHTNQLTNEPRVHELRFFISLADCKMLRYLQVGSNPLNGILPNYIGNLSSTIEYFNIDDAHISGLIPTSIGNMSGLTSLDIQGNNLIGSIPPDVGKLKQLQGLCLSTNKLQGHIPKAACHLSNLVELYLDGNELSGLIPECFGNLHASKALFGF
ncbi:hypothetical protein MTR67_017097 [Solanum verrucosum]|uniref:Protein kinase domain-containing protein n=1 Tax=Solanum verrucosum TaxID=315347 RepID=A0AAF0QHB9_SOLVR|nr:hypothetical protein MTR67_017097 [Solanum verrucosum]